MYNKYINTKSTAFICPHCGVYAQLEKYSCGVKKDSSDNNYIPLTNPLKEIVPQPQIQGITGKIECERCMVCGNLF